MLRGEIVTADGRVRLACVLVAAAFGAWLVSTPTAAHPPQDLRRLSANVLLPPVGDTLVAGETVSLPRPALPAEVEEFELLLSLDGGGTYPIRLTPELAPGSPILTWTVPNLPTPAARIRLRVGVEGHEVEGEPSAVFRLLSRPDRAATPLWFSGGEWWACVGASWAPVELAPRSQAFDRAQEAAADESAAVPPSIQPLTPPSRRVLPGDGLPEPPVVVTAVAASLRNPRVRPQRE